MLSSNIGRTSGVSRGRKIKQSTNSSKYQRIHDEAAAILQAKRDEIDQFSSAVEEAEKRLAAVKAEYEKKVNLEDQDHFADDPNDKNDYENELNKLIEEHEQEIQQLKASHEEELQNLQESYTRALQEEENYIDQHAENVYLERKAVLEDLQRELDELRLSNHENAFSITQSKTRMYQQAKSTSLANAQRIQELEQQLSDLTSMSREEMREIRTKIDECLVSVDIRDNEHKGEVHRYESEIAQRQEKYDQHLQNLALQFTNEKQRMELTLQAATAKVENLQRLLKQNETHHEKILQTTLRDIEKMKTSLYQTKTRNEDSTTDFKTSIVTIQNAQRECRNLEQEIAIIKDEIKEIVDENKELNKQLQSLNKSVYIK